MIVRRLIPFVLLFLGCGTVVIRSSPPEADVTLVLPGKEKGKDLGKTPYEGDFGDLGEAVQGGSVVVRISKRGYLPQNYVMPNIDGGRLEIDATLLPNLPSNFQEVNRIVTLLFRAERFILEKRLDEAIKTAEEIKKINDNVAGAFHIEGTAFFLQNKLKESRFSWIRSLELEPGNAEALAMLSTLEKKMGIAPRPTATKP